MKRGIAGSLESNDVLITVRESDKLEITVKSVVYDFFHKQIEKVIRETLDGLGIDKISVYCEDKGALDYTIKARLTVAVRRMEAAE